MAMRLSLLLSTALTAALALPAQAQAGAPAQPQGGQVVAGAASIAQTAAVTAITQSSENAAINWQSFTVGSAQTVTVQQPNAQAMLLNRVVGPDPSVIAGHITANGGVAIVNQSGVVFTPGSQVDVQTLVVSTANISNTNFMAGKLAFDVPGKPNAAVVNRGTITVKQAGLAALVAPSVRNTGLIQAKLGHVVLAGAEAATLDLYGDGLVSIDVTKQVTRAPIGPGGKPVEALVTNTGTIRADGGTVQLTAAAADGVVQNLVSAGGTISVNGGRGAGGTITLTGVGGSMVIEGALTATGATGGTVQAVTDGAVTVAAASRLDASGRHGGGTITLGGGQAASVTVAKGAVLKADATSNGNGGRVAVVGRNSAVVNGTISARGGKRGGNGGTVEISAVSVGITGSIDTSAPAGQVGTILLDPDFLTIVDGAAGSGSQDPTFVANNGTVPNSAPPAGSDTITDQVISAFAGNVLLEANQSITVASGVHVNLTSGSGQNLVLEAGGTIAVAAGATLRASGNVVLETGDAVSFVPPVAAANPLVQIDGTVASTHGDVFINAGTGGTIAMGADGLVSVAGSGNALMSLVGDALELTPGAQLRGLTLELAPATMGTTVTLGSAGLATLDGIEVATLVVGGAAVPGGSVPVVSAGTITVAGTFDATAVEALELLATGALTQTAPIINVGLLAGQAGTISLTNAGNTISGLGSLSASAGGLAVASTIPVTVFGPLAAGAGNVYLSAPGVTLDSAVTASGQIGLQTNTLSVAGGSLTAPLVELAPLTAGTMVSLGGPGGLSLASMAGISATTLRLGGITAPGDPGPTTTAGAISIAGAFDASAAATLDLRTTGAVTQSAALTEPGTLTGSVESLTLTDPANRIGTLGTFATVGTLALNDAGPTMTVAGPVVADGSATLTEVGTLTIAGSLAAAGITLSAAAIDLPGQVDAGTFTLALLSGGNITETGSLAAGTLTGSAGGSAELAGSNRIGTLGNFAAGADFFLDDGAVAAASSTLTVSGAVAAGTAPAAGSTPNTLAIDATGLLSITGSVTSGRAGAGYRGGSVVLSAADQPGGTTGALAVSGSVAAVGNGTGGADSITVTAPAIAIGGTLSATSDLAHALPGLVTLQADTLTIGGTVSVPDGMVAIAPLTLDALAVAAAPVAGSLTLAPADLQRIGVTGTGAPGAGSGELVLGSLDGATASVGTLSLQAALALPGLTTLGLFSRGDLTQDAATPLTVASLVGQAGQIALPAANAIATIGRAGVPFAPAGTPAYAGLTASGDIDLNNAAALSVGGPIGLVSGLGTASPGASLTLTESGTLLVDGPLGNCGTGALTVSADAITLGVTTAPTVWSLGAATLTSTGALVVQAGVLDGAGIALGGTISQSGGVIASSGSLSLAGPFTQSAGTLIAAGVLSQSSGTADLGGVAAAGSAALGATTVSGMLTTGGDLSAAALTVTAGTVAAGGALTVGSGTGTAGTASGTATTGGFAQSGGTVLAGGDITVWSTGTAVQTDGTLAAGGTLSLTAAGLAQGMGSSGAALISGGAAVRLYAASGDARQGDWGTLAAAAGGIAVQAPTGDVTVWNIAPAATLTGGAAVSQAFVCAAACAGIPGALTAGAPVSLAGATGRVDVALLGNAIDLFANATPGSAAPLVLTAGTLFLISRLDTTEALGSPVIDALLVTGSAGLSTPALPPDLQAPASWAPAASSAVQLGGLTGGGTVAQTVTNANRIATLGPYVATGGLSVTDATALTVAGPVQAIGDVVLAAAGALSVPGSVAGADVMLVANENLLNAGAGSTAAPAGLTIAGSVLVPTGTLELNAESDIVETGTLAAAVLTGRAGLLAADTALPPNERVDVIGSVSLTGTASGEVSSNTLGSVGALLATGSIALEASPASGTVTLAGPITAGYGGLAPTSSVTVRIGDAAGGPGTLAVAGPLAVGSAGGAIVLAASGDVTVTGLTTAGTSDTLVTAPDSIAVFAGRGLDGTALGGGAFTQSGGLVVAGGVSISAPAGMTLNGGLVLSTGTIGIVVPDGASTITGGLMMAGGSGSVQLAALTQTGGTVSANGSIAVAGALAQSGGTLAAAGDVVLGALMQSAGTVSAGGMVAIGAGTGIAGDIGSNATSGGFEQTGGVLVATGDIAIWTTGTASQSAGTLAAGGQVGLTAGGALSQSHAGLLSGAGGVALLANGGDAAQDATALVAGGAVTVQAPAGDVSFVNVALAGTVAAAAASITAAPVAALAAPAPAAQTASSRVTVTLAGDTISILRDLTAGQLTLTSSAATQQTAGTVIDADTLSGSAGSATLGTLADPSGATELGSNANRIAVLGDYATTGALSLTDATVLTVTGPVQAGTSLRIGTAGALSVTGTITAGNALLLANENLFNPGNPVSAAAADLAIAGSVATAGTLTLWAERNLDATGAVAAALLTGRAGVLAADTTLPQNFRANLVGSADLTGANTVATLGTLLATGGVVFADTQASGTLSVTGPVTAGDGTLAASDAVLTVAGNQVVTGIVSAPAGSASLEATGDVTLTGGVVRGSTVILATTGDKILNSGLIASTGAGIDLTGGATVMYGGTISATSTGSLTTAALTQDGGTISANGSAGLASLTQSAGTLATVGNIAIAGALSQSGGTVSTGGTLSLGTGTGTAGLGGSAASAGALQQTGGTLLGSGDIVLWSASPAVSQQSGVIAAGGRVGMTAEAGIAQQGGTISGAGGVALLANTGDLTQDATGVLAGPAATGAGPGVMVLAPQGNTDAVTVLLAGAVGTATPASTGSVAAVSLGPLGAQAAARVDVLLLGDSIVLDKNLTAGTLGLYSLGDTQLDAGQVIDALVLQGSAGWSTGWSVPAATGWTGAPLGWTAGTGSAVLGSTGVPLTTADQTLSSLNRIPTLSSYAATGNLSFADAVALDVTGPVQVAGSATLAAGGTLTVAGSLSAANLLLIANHALGNLTVPADLLLPGTIVAPGTLELWAERNLTATGPITAGVLAARAGGLAADTTLPTNFRHDLVGTIALTGSNAIATIGPVLATGNVTIDTATTALSGPVVAGYGGLVAAPSLDLQVAGDLTATGQVTSPGGTATIAATGAITLTDALVFAPTSVAITAGTAYAQTGGTVFSDSVTVAAPARTLDGGAILAPGPAARIDLAGGSTTVTDAGVISAGGAAALVSFGTLSLASGTVASAGALQADAVVQQAGTIAAVGNAQFGNLQQQTGGLLAVGGNLTVGTGTGTAGQVGSQAATGAATAAGSVDVAGTLTLWSAGSIGLSGTVLAGRVLATAATGIDQSAGTLVGGTGVALLTTGGDAVQDAPSGAVLAGGATDGVAVRAPLGTVSFGNITLPGGTLPAPPSVSLAAPSLTCTACTVPLPWIGTVLPASTVTVPAPVLTAQPATSGIPDVTLAGATIQQDPPQGLTAGTLSLFATHAIDEQGTLVADVLTGTAGLAQPAEGLSATDPAAWVHLDGSANSIATLGDVTSTGVLRLTDAQPLAIPDSTISAPLIRLLVTDAITIQGGVFITGGETGLPPRGGLATDPTDATYTDDSQRGLYISFTGTTGQVSQTGLTQLQPIGALPALLRIDLPLGTSNSVSFDPRNGLDYGLFGRTAAVFLHLGDGWASGNINVGQLSVIYASVPPIQTRMTGTLLSAEGVVIDSQLAASLASIGTSNGQFLPSGIFQLNGCALTSSDCVMMGGHDSVPVQSPLRPIDFGSPLDPNEDPDLLAPDISDRDY